MAAAALRKNRRLIVIVSLRPGCSLSTADESLSGIRPDTEGKTEAILHRR